MNRTRRHLLISLVLWAVLHDARAVTSNVRARVSFADATGKERLLQLLIDFSDAEHLLLSNDKQMHDTRVVTRRTMVLEDATRFIASNFDDPDVFEFHVIAQGDGDAWKVVWDKLLRAIAARIPDVRIATTE